MPQQPSVMPFLNIPYQWGGNNPVAGMDCFHLASYIQRANGRLPLPDHQWIYRRFTDESLPYGLVLDRLQHCFGMEARDRRHLNLVAIEAEKTIIGTLWEAEKGWQIIHFNRTHSVATPLAVIAKKTRLLGMWDSSSRHYPVQEWMQ
jgi:hypothetical protein